MPLHIDAIVVSPRRLVRELLASVVAERCRVQLIDQWARIEDCQPTPNTRLLVWDVERADRKTETRLRKDFPQMRIVSVGRDASMDDLLAQLRGSLSLPEDLRERLTRLECEVLLGIAGGERNADIARRMRRSSKTVEKHRANLQRKLGLKTVAALTAFAIREGLLKPEGILRAARER